jgi:hypothetical protein
MLLLGCCISMHCCAQSNQPANQLFVGSTPADSLIKLLLQIPATEKIDFIKWELRLPSGKDSGTFSFIALYGEEQPGTNGFKSSKQLIANGKYTVRYGTTQMPATKVFFLDADRLNNNIVLVQLDNDVLHFADSKRHLLAGNGGFGYALNKEQ